MYVSASPHSWSTVEKKEKEEEEEEEEEEETLTEFSFAEASRNGAFHDSASFFPSSKEITLSKRNNP